MAAALALVGELGGLPFAVEGGFFAAEEEFHDAHFFFFLEVGLGGALLCFALLLG